MSKIKIKSVFILFFCASLTMAQNDITEILGRPTDRSVTLNVMFPDSAQFFCEYSKVDDSQIRYTDTIFTQWDKVGEIVMGNLQKNTSYRYRTAYRHTTSEDFQYGEYHTFRTQRDKADTYNFVVFGDTHLGSTKHCNPDLYNQTLMNAKEESPDFFFILGDDFRSSKLTTPTKAQIEQLFINQRPYLSTLACSSPLFSVVGNHERESGYVAYKLEKSHPVHQTQSRKKHIPNPVTDHFYSGNVSEDSLVGNRESYYAFTWGDALFVVLDYYWYSGTYYEDRVGEKTTWETSIGDEQYFWFRQTLEKSPAKYKFVLAHHVLSSGRGGVSEASRLEWGDANKLAQYRPTWGKTIHQLLVDNRVTAFIQGHDHVFAREELDGVSYITAPFPGDALYESYNTESFSGDVIGNSGHLSFQVSVDDVVFKYIRSVFPKDETDTIQNKTVSYEYSLIKKQVHGKITSVSNVSSEQKKMKIYPNPFRDSISIQIDLKTPGKVNLIIYDLSGKQVDKIKTDYLNSGINTIKWDAVKRNGKPCKRGVYSCKIISPDGIQSEKLIRIE